MWHKSCKFNMQMGSKPVSGLQVMQQFFTWPTAKCVFLHFITVKKLTQHARDHYTNWHTSNGELNYDLWEFHTCTESRPNSLHHFKGMNCLWNVTTWSPTESVTTLKTCTFKPTGAKQIKKFAAFMKSCGLLLCVSLHTDLTVSLLNPYKM